MGSSKSNYTVSESSFGSIQIKDYSRSRTMIVEGDVGRQRGR